MVNSSYDEPVPYAVGPANLLCARKRFHILVVTFPLSGLIHDMRKLVLWSFLIVIVRSLRMSSDVDEGRSTWWAPPPPSVPIKQS